LMSLLGDIDIEQFNKLNIRIGPSHWGPDWINVRWTN
jgi:hypothetical protein